MARYFRKDLGRTHAPKPDIVPLSGLQPFRRRPVADTYESQDILAASHAQVVCTFGLRGCSSWQYENGTPPDDVTMESTTEIGSARVRLPPGSMVALKVIYIPSGPYGDASIP